MKRILFTTLLCLAFFGATTAQVQNTKLAQGLVMAVQSGMNTIPGSALTSGTLDSLGTYVIGNYVSGDDFTNIGGTNASGTTFKATGTTPTTWTNGSLLRKIDQSALTLPNPTFNLTNTGAVPTYGHKGNASYWEFDGVDDYILVPHSNAWNFGTGDFSIGFTFQSKSSTNPADIEILLTTYRTAGVPYVSFLMTNAGLVKSVFYDGSSEQSVETSIDFNDGEKHHLFCVFDRSGNMVTYIDNDSASTLDISSYSAVDFNDATNTMKIGGGISTYYFDGRIYNTYLFNYALSASEVAYYSNPANHPKLIDQTATGADIVSGWDFTSGWTNFAATVDDQNTFTSSGNGGLFKSITTAGKKYIVEISGTSTTSIRIWASDGSSTYLNGLNGTFSATSSPTASASNNTIYINNLSSGETSITSFRVFEAGATLILSPEGMLSQSLWRDYYHSVDVSVGTGATAPRLVKSWSGMNAWRFGGVDYLTSTTFPDISENLTVSFYVYATSTGGATLGRVFDGGNIYLRMDADNYRLAFSRDASTVIESASNSIPLNEWVHCVITSTSTGVTNFYINGVLSGTANRSAGTPGTVTQIYYGNNGGAIRGMVGCIEGLRIYDKVFSAEEIALDFATYQN